MAELKLLPLAAHHAAWLDAHPYRSEYWLRDRLADGFDVHHVDHNHDNNSADNLVLIERTDHNLMHGANPARRAEKAASLKKTDERLEKGRRIYEAKQPGVSWRRAAMAAGLPINRYSDPTTLKRMADAYAAHAGLPLRVHLPVKSSERLPQP